MPDNLQRKNSSGEKDPPEQSTGRRGGHPAPEPGRPNRASDRKKEALREKPADFERVD